MRAAVVTAHGMAPAPGEHPDPEPGAGQVLLEVTAAPIVPLDLLCASGTSYFGAPPLPYVPGVQGVGRVVSGGSGGSLAPGTRVWFPTTAGMQPGDGSLAEHAVAFERELVEVPAGVAETMVAALGLSGVAAWMALTWRARLGAGEQVLVLGAGGIVGQVAVQAARLLGAGRVVAAARSQAGQERARACGADAVVPLRDGEDPAELAGRLDEACDGPVDVVVDPLCGVPSTAAARLLGTHGRLVNLGSSAGPTASYDSAHLRSHTASILGYTNNELTDGQRRDALRAVLGHAVDSGLAVAHEVVDLDDVAAAWQRQATGTADRRLVVRVAP